MGQWNEIARQGAQAAVQETVRERMDAIRARQMPDEENAKRTLHPLESATADVLAGIHGEGSGT